MVKKVFLASAFLVVLAIQPANPVGLYMPAPAPHINVFFALKPITITLEAPVRPVSQSIDDARESFLACQRSF